MKVIHKIQILLLVMLCTTITPLYAQVEIGADVMSRYVWRGTDFGNSPSIQPSLSFSTGNLTIGGWAAMATNGNPAGSEIDFYASYALGAFSLNLTDYTFPEAPTGNYFDAASHFVELGLAYDGSGVLPISVSTGMFVTNDDDYSIYTQFGYTFSNVELFLGFTPSASVLYGTQKAGIISTGLSASKEVQLSETFGISLKGSVVANPYANNGFLLFGIGL